MRRLSCWAPGLMRHSSVTPLKSFKPKSGIHLWQKLTFASFRFDTNQFSISIRGTINCFWKLITKVKVFSWRRSHCQSRKLRYGVTFHLLHCDVTFREKRIKQKFTTKQLESESESESEQLISRTSLWCTRSLENGNRTWATWIGGIHLNHQTMLSPWLDLWPW